MCCMEFGLFIINEGLKTGDIYGTYIHLHKQDASYHFITVLACKG